MFKAISKLRQAKTLSMAKWQLRNTLPLINFRKMLFTETVSTNKKLFTETVSANKKVIHRDWRSKRKKNVKGGALLYGGLL